MSTPGDGLDLRTRGQIEAFIRDRFGPLDVFIRQLQGLTFLQASGSAVVGPGALGAAVVYSPAPACELTLTPGTWLVWACATLVGGAALDTKVIALWDVAAGAELTGTRGSGGSAPTLGYPENHQTVAVVTVAPAATKTVRILGKPNGASTMQIGLAAAGVQPTQRMLGVLLQPAAA